MMRGMLGHLKKGVRGGPLYGPCAASAEIGAPCRLYLCRLPSQSQTSQCPPSGSQLPELPAESCQVPPREFCGSGYHVHGPPGIWDVQLAIARSKLDVS